MAGDVGLDDESADAGTATFEREKDLSIENNVRDLLRKIDGALRRMDAKTYGLRERWKSIEKRDRARPVRGALHQGRAGRAIPPPIAWTRRGAGRRRSSSSPPSSSTWPRPRHEDRGERSPGDPIDPIPGVLTLRFTTNSGGAFSIGQSAPWFFVGVSAVVAASLATAFRHTSRLVGASLSGSSSAERSGT